MANKYLLSISQTSKTYSISRDKLYAASKTGKLGIFVKIGCTTKVHVPLLEKLLQETAEQNKELFL